MKIAAVISEYNPFHFGHKHLLDKTREAGATHIVSVMSGNFVQRGAPAIVDKSIRAHAAVLSGADLVLELPVSVCLSSAEGFAQGGVRILSQFCDTLCFGTESMTAEALYQTASALLSSDFSALLKEEMEGAVSLSVPMVADAHVGKTWYDAKG